MPTYEFECPDCDVVVEKTCCFAERYDAPPCPRCGGETHQVIRTAPTFALKGSGWARDGYAVRPAAQPTGGAPSKKKP